MRDETATLYAQVHNRVDELLYYVWDPIGVAGIPEARGEYDAYIPGVMKMLLAGSGALEIGGYLGRVVTETMGLSGSSEGARHSEKVA